MSTTQQRNYGAEIGRLQVVDLARGVAVIGMVIFHGGWDLGSFWIIDPAFLGHWAWLWFSYIIAGGFILIAGMAQIFAAMKAQPARRFWRRLAQIVAGAGLITAATLTVYPESYIFFGILHHIALSSLLLLVAQRLPSAALLALAVVLLLLPLLAIGGPFNQGWLLWLGLADHIPNSYDYVPLAPWFALGLFGAVLARATARYWPRVKGLAQWRSASRPVRALEFLGHHSLIIYLAHQPVLWGLAYLWATYVMA